jgi:hypothetical protein
MIGRNTIARHGSKPSCSAPRSFPAGPRLPSGVDVGCAAGHVDPAPLEKLWYYCWYRVRPGLRLKRLVRSDVNGQPFASIAELDVLIEEQ